MNPHKKGGAIHSSITRLDSNLRTLEESGESDVPDHHHAALAICQEFGSIGC